MNKKTVILLLTTFLLFGGIFIWNPASTEDRNDKVASVKEINRLVECCKGW